MPCDDRCPSLGCGRGRSRGDRDVALVSGGSRLIGLVAAVVAPTKQITALDSRGRSEAKRLARDILVNPSVTVFSKESLNINPLGPGGGVPQPMQPGGGCAEITVDTLKGGAYSRSYSGFTLPIRSGDKYFLTPTPIDRNTAWDPENDSIFVIPDDGDVRIELARGADYAPQVESAATPPPAFTCQCD